MNNKLFFITLLSISSLMQLIQASDADKRSIDISNEMIALATSTSQLTGILTEVIERKLITIEIQNETIERQLITLEHLTTMLDFPYAKNR